ncbi:MAG TPA: hypothetical protein VFO77_13610 [Actinoplanes sp.]|nr:hypothetical protein [Actinoplanes sp.]
MFPSLPPEGDRETWKTGAVPGRAGTFRDPTGAVPVRPPAGASGRTGHAAAAHEPAVREDPDPAPGDEDEIEVPFVPVRRELSLAVAGFAGLLAIGLILGAQTSGPDARAPYAVVIFGVQVLHVLAWTVAMRPPAFWTVAAIGVSAGLVGDVLAVNREGTSLWPLVVVIAAGVLLAVVVQLIRAADRARIRDTVASTFFIVAGAVAFASLISLTRRPVGTQSILVFFAATGVALVVARLIDAFFARPRIAPQVPRGATGIIVGAMLATLAAAGLGSVLVLPFTPAKGAVLGLVAGVFAGLVDLAVNYGEAGRVQIGRAPTLWVARHMQGPIGAAALAAPLTYAMAMLVLG